MHRETVSNSLIMIQPTLVCYFLSPIVNLRSQNEIRESGDAFGDDFFLSGSGIHNPFRRPTLSMDHQYLFYYQLPVCNQTVFYYSTHSSQS